MKKKIFLLLFAILMFSCESENEKAKRIISQMEEINSKAIHYQSLVVLYLDSAKIAGLNKNETAVNKYMENSKIFTKETKRLETEWDKLKKSLPKKYRSMLSE